MPDQGTERATVPHSWIEDLQGLAIGIILASLGLQLLTFLGLLTGQTAGLALIIAYLTGWSFGTVFFVINLPFYWLAYRKLGLEFTIKSLICVGLVSFTTDAFPLGLEIARLNPFLGALLFGVTTGLGLLAVFRHRSSLGGLGVLALIIQDRFGFRAGYVQLITDSIIFAIALMLFDAKIVAFSTLGALILNGVIAFNHRRDRYIAF
ncbi:MAG: YitT family protein [Mangrovicoccus sp.]